MEKELEIRVNANPPRFDAAEYLDTSEACIEFLQAALETQDVPHIINAIGVVARAIGIRSSRCMIRARPIIL